MFAIDGSNYVLDATLRGGVARFINHSCDVCRAAALLFMIIF